LATEGVEGELLEVGGTKALTCPPYPPSYMGVLMGPSYAFIGPYGGFELARPKAGGLLEGEGAKG